MKARQATEGEAKNQGAQSMNQVQSPDNSIQNLSLQLVALESMSTAQLRDKWREVFFEDSRSHNRQYLIKRLQYKIQEREQGGLSEAARQRILELSNTSTLRYRSAPARLSRAAGPSEPKEPTTTAQNPAPPLSEQLGQAQQDQAQGQAHPKDSRLPAPGTILQRQFQGENIAVKVLDDGFEFQGKTHKSLSKIARLITGTHWNGFAFFGLKKQTKSD